MRRRRWLWLPVRALQNAALAAAVATLSIWLWPPERHYSPYLSPLYSLERLGYDSLFAVRGPQFHRIDPRIEVVGFDHQSEKDLGVRWPPPRRLHARVIQNLARDGARLIVYDVLLSGPTNPQDDRALDAALKRAGNVVLASRVDRDYAERRKSLEEPYYDDALGIDFLARARVGFADVATDPEDQVVRRIAPIQSFQDRWLPSLAAAAYQTLRGEKEESCRLEPGWIVVGGLRIPRSGPTVLDPVDSRPIPSAYVDFPAGHSSFVMSTSFAEVAQGRFAQGQFKDKIVFVGIGGSELARESFDEYATAYSNLSPEQYGGLSYKKVPGVVLQAQLLNAMLTDGFVVHQPDWSIWIVVFGLTLLGAHAVRSYFNWRGPAVLVLGALLYVTYAIFTFRSFRIHVPWTAPTLLMLSTVSVVAYFERGALRRKWSGYVSPAVLEQILRSEDATTAQRCIGTVLFGDIRGFTTFTNRHSPETVVRLLNLHFERLTRIIYAQGGTVDKFFGDGVMALFGVPVARENSALAAVRAAWDMSRASREPLYLDGKAYVLESGFAVTTGPLVAGHVGGRTRHEYTVIGDAVNLSARLQGITGESDVVLDAATYALVSPFVEVESLGEIAVKGLPAPVPCYRVLACREAPVIPRRTLRRNLAP